MKEKLTAILLCIGMLSGMVTPLAADADDTYEDVNKNILEDENLLEYEDDVWLYMEDGDITLSVNDDGYTSYLQNEAQGICKTAYISNKDKSVSCDRCITINSSVTNDIDIVLSHLNISATVALCVNGSGNVNIELDGSNILKSSSYSRAGLEVSTDSSIVINDMDNNGFLEAQGKGAGIGSATGKNNGKITINGGTVTANGGFNSAGIGGGDDGGAGLVIINGGEINASSNWYGCGIGSGSYNDVGGTIIINGGKINATGNVHGAGIGGSDGGDVDELIITGGEIISTGKGWMAGVGGGDSKSIVILGGNIKVSGGGCDIGFSNGAVHVASVTGRNEDGSFTSVNHIHTYDTIISDEPATLTSPRTISFYCLDENCPKYGEIIYYSFGTALTEESITSSISTTFDTSTVALQEGDTFNFDGIVSTTAEDGLTAVQIDIHKADDDTVGITYTRKTNTDETSPLSGNSFDLSSIPSFQAGDTLTGTTQSITLSADTSWNIYLYAKDTDGNTLGGSVVKRIDIVEKEVPFVAGKTYAQSTNTDKFNGFDAPYFVFNEDNTGKFHWVDSETGESGKDNFTYTISDDTITLTANGLYYLGNVAEKIVLKIVDEKHLKVAEIINLNASETLSISCTSVDDQFEVGVKQTKPIVSGLQNSYTVTQGDTLNLNFTVTAGNNGKLKVVTVREDGKTTNTYKKSDISANSHTVNCTIDTNTIGTHTYIVYTYADNYTVTDNVVATFTVTVKAKDIVGGEFEFSDTGKKILMNLEGSIVDSEGMHLLYDDDKDYSKWNRPTIGYGTLIANLDEVSASDYNSLLDEITNGVYTSISQIMCEKGVIKITKEKAIELLNRRLNSSVAAVNNYMKEYGISLKQNEFDALVIWFYNLGNARLANNQDCRLAKVLRGEKGLAGQEIDEETVKEAFTTWCLCAGKPLSGLVKRRLVEANIFLYGYENKNYSTNPSDYYTQADLDFYYKVKNERETNPELNPSVYENIKQDTSDKGESEQPDKPNEYTVIINNSIINSDNYENLNNSKLTITINGVSDNANYSVLQLTNLTTQESLEIRCDDIGNGSSKYTLYPKQIEQGAYKLAFYSGYGEKIYDSAVLIDSFKITHYEIDEAEYSFWSNFCNDERDNYINKKINEWLKDEDVKKTLTEGKSVVYFFEGCGNDLDTAKRMAALCIVIRLNDEGTPYVAFQNRNSTTIPDDVRNTLKNQNPLPPGPVPIVRDGKYEIQTKLHYSKSIGKYASLNVLCNKQGDVVRFCDNYYSSDEYLEKYNKDSDQGANTNTLSFSSGINIHARSSNDVSPKEATWANSAGCFNVGKLNEDDKYTEYNNFILAITGVSNAISTSSYTEWEKMGYVIIDRELYRENLCEIYGDDNTCSARHTVKKILNETDEETDYERTE